MEMDRQNMILIGFMGAGKTSVGEELAGRFGKTLIDTDRMIEERAGMSISDIFAAVSYTHLDVYQRQPDERIFL